MTSSATTYYERVRAPRPQHPPLAGAHRAEVAIIGGGLAGLAVALGLAERGVRPCLLEAEAIGAGGSGRNGGLLQPGFARSAESLERTLGRERSQALHALSHDAVRLVRDRIRRHAIPCGPVDGVVMASFFDDPDALRAECHLLNERYGAKLAFWPRDELRARYASPRYFDGLYDPDACHLDPLALAEGYARAAHSLGASLHETSPATSLTGGPAGWRVTTPAGSVTAPNVVLCQSAYPPPVERLLSRSILGVFTYIIVTEPLAERARTAIRAPHAVFDDRFATGYYRLLADDRLLWGGRVALREDPDRLRSRMLRDLAFVYPQLSGVTIADAWSGRMGFARHKMPLIGEARPGLWLSTGFGGHGLNTTTLAGELIAGALAEGDDRWRLFEPFQPEPVFGPLGRLAAQGIYWGHSAKDAVRTRWHRRRARQH